MICQPANLGFVWSVKSSTEDILSQIYAHHFQANAQEPKHDVSKLPSETIEFAHRMFEAARTGDSTLLLSAVDAGLPVNLMNDKGFQFSLITLSKRRA